MNLPVSTTWLPGLSQLNGLPAVLALGSVLGLDGLELLHTGLTAFASWSWATLGTSILWFRYKLKI